MPPRSRRTTPWQVWAYAALFVTFSALAGVFIVLAGGSRPPA